MNSPSAGHSGIRTAFLHLFSGLYPYESVYINIFKVIIIKNHRCCIRTVLSLNASALVNVKFIHAEK